MGRGAADLDLQRSAHGDRALIVDRVQRGAHERLRFDPEDDALRDRWRWLVSRDREVKLTHVVKLCIQTLLARTQLGDLGLERGNLRLVAVAEGADRLRSPDGLEMPLLVVYRWRLLLVLRARCAHSDGGPDRP